MARVWKVGSRWDEFGAAGTSIKEFFIQYNIAIVGTDQERVLCEVKKGDYIGLADGYRIIAVGKVFEEPKRLSEFNFQKTDFPKIFEYDENNVGFRCDFKELDIAFEYKKQGTFCEAFQIADNIKELYNKLVISFDISPSEILYNILENHYVVPIYQRPYSWENPQIERFITDIFVNYWGEDTLSIPETMFIGTMELSDSNNENYKYIVDGQQRLTTLMLLIQILKLRFPICNSLKNIQLKTVVNNGSQQNLMDELLNLPLQDLKDDVTNKYLSNSFLINNILTSKLVDNPPFCFDVTSFVDYLLSDIKFVVINIKAGLSKTLQVFNIINTAGLDLAHGDIFKLRMFEYLGSKETDFKTISGLYERIANYNKEIGLNETNISEILKLYQVEIISTYKLPNILYGYEQARFFDELFDRLLKIKTWDHFSNLGDLKLSVTEIERLIEVRYKWRQGKFTQESNIHLSCEDYCNMHFIDWSRYSRYNYLRFLFINRFGNEKLSEFLCQISKYFSIYSIVFDKSVYHVQRKMFELLKIMYENETTSNTVIDLICKYINEEMPYQGDCIKAVRNVLIRDIAYNTKKKNIICRTSAMLEENDLEATQSERIEAIRNKIFWIPIDIEHIQSYNDEDLTLREIKQKEWGNDLNAIGNLVVLETSINRSISNKEIRKSEGYNKSQFNSVKLLVKEVQIWSLEKSIKRKECETEKLIKHWFSIISDN